MNDVFKCVLNHIDAPLTLIDVGGHGGALENWQQFGDKARVICFEARSDEANALVETNTDRNVEYVPLGLSDDHDDIEVSVAAAAGCSSAYPPIPAIYRRYPGCAIMRPIAKVVCPTTTLDDFLAERGVDAVHGLKLDTQGFELRILKGAEQALRHCQFILIEVEFNPLYEGQPLFCDVDRFLRDRGFVLWRLGNLAHYATEKVDGDQHHMMIGSDPGIQQSIPVTNGQLFWSDAFYVRREATAANDEGMDRLAARAGAALVSQYNFNDLALEMVRKSGDEPLLKEMRAALDLEFSDTPKTHFPAEDFLSLHLTRTDAGWQTDFTTTDGCIVYGPYARLPEGIYEAVFHVRSTGSSRKPLRSRIEFDVAADMVTLNSADLTGASGAEALGTGRIVLPFYNSQPKATVEFRISTFGRPFDGLLIFSGVTVRRTASWPDLARRQRPTWRNLVSAAWSR